MRRLKTRPQFQAVLAAGTVARSAHFALHRLVLPTAAIAPCPEPGDLPSGGQTPQALFAVGRLWLGAMAPKRWARRAVTRNAIKRQVYAVGADFEARLMGAAYVVRLRAAFDRQQFPSASSPALKAVIRAELQQIFGHAARLSAAGARAAEGAPERSVQGAAA